jgi:hypothetical protein
MDNKIIIDFNYPCERALLEKLSPLGQLFVNSAPSPPVHLIDKSGPFPIQLEDPYKTYFTIALPPYCWRYIAKNDLPTIDEQINKINEILIAQLLIKADTFYAIETNKDLERVHIHGVICNKKNMNQLILFKKIIRKHFHIPPSNKVAIKLYPQSDYRNQIDMLNYHLKSIDYSKKIKLSPQKHYYHIEARGRRPER